MCGRWMSLRATGLFRFIDYAASLIMHTFVLERISVPLERFACRPVCRASRCAATAPPQPRNPCSALDRASEMPEPGLRRKRTDRPCALRRVSSGRGSRWAPTLPPRTVDTPVQRPQYSRSLPRRPPIGSGMTTRLPARSAHRNRPSRRRVAAGGLLLLIGGLAGCGDPGGGGGGYVVQQAARASSSR